MTPISEWLAAGSFFDYKGHQIFWREAGRPENPVLLLVHGFPTASWDWESIWDDLSSHYRVITLDMIGFGFSDKPYVYDYRIMDQADLCDAFLKRMGVKSYHLLAHDYGVTVAQELIARDIDHGQRPTLLSVGLLNGGLFPETHRRLRSQSLLLSPIGPLLSRLTSKKAIAKNMEKIFGPHAPPDKATIDAFWELMRAKRGKRILHKLIQYIPDRIAHRERWVGALQRTPRPVKLINGLVDPVSGAHMVRRYRELVGDPDVTELPQIGHYPQVQAPREVLDAYLDFQRGLGVVHEGRAS
ncbi:MAG: alpha/beta hydrolase [Burkholderiaceae bacterium]|nr:alpha/beta hydrolase [Burkholderiaceae bacterium]